MAGALALSACDEEPGLSRLELAGTFAPAALEFGNVTVGSAKAVTVTFQNSGQIAYEVDRVELPNDFTLRGLDEPLEGRPLAPSGSVSFDVVFFPQVVGARSETLVLVSGDSRFELPLTGNGALPTATELTVEPTQIDFGEVRVGDSASRTIFVRNVGDTEATVTGFVLASTRSDASSGTLFATRTPAPVKVPAGQSAALEVSFTPTNANAYTEVLEIISPSLPSPLTVNLQGRGSDEPPGTLICTPASLIFGTVERGSRFLQTVTCGPQGGQVSINGASSNNTADFQIVQPAPTGVIGAGESFDVGVEFVSSGALGPRSGTLTIEYLGVRGTERVEVALNAQVGAPPASETAFTVQLDWNTNETDLDLHLTAPGGAPFAFRDCYFGDSSPDWGVPGDPADDCFLDVDDRDGLGPERINVGRAAAGTYRVYVHYFEDAFRRGNTEGRVTVSLGGQQVGVYLRSGLLCNDMWLVGEIRWDGATGSFVEVNRVDFSLFGRCF